MEMMNIVLETFRDEIGKNDIAQAKPLKSLFNKLNGNSQNCIYPFSRICGNGELIKPLIDQSGIQPDNRKEIFSEVQALLESYETVSSKQEVDSLLDELERELSYVPCAKEDLEDVSLFEYARLRAGIRCVTGESEKGEILFVSMDMSGIQQFIYHMYDSSDVLKNLRTRSFYLEILMENIVDELLSRFELSRANLLYVGGGHAYLMLPYTNESMDKLSVFEKETNAWFREFFDTGLYLAIGYTKCVETDLYNSPVGSYNRIFREVSESVSAKKRHRYTCDEIKKLNGMGTESGRECRICHSSSKTVIKGNSDVCEICGGLIEMAPSMLTERYFVICYDESNGIPIYPKMRLRVCGEEAYKALLKENRVVRTFVKNDVQKGCKCIYVGDYSAGKTVSDLVCCSKGIQKLGVVRGDVDNLGHAFVFGFEKPKQNIFRAIAFSKSLSMFFKYSMNSILRSHDRKVSIVYSGGDDIFFLGAWNEVLEAVLDIEKELRDYSLGSLSISAGFGMFDEKYPISYIADLVGDLEDQSKKFPGKNAITLFSPEPGHTYTWGDLRTKVIAEKKNEIRNCLKSSGERGTAFLYNIIEMVRNSSDRLNVARLAYLLGRLSPQDDPEKPEKHEQYLAYQRFEKKLMEWIKFSGRDEERQQFITAAELYVYENRNANGGEVNGL